MQTGSTNSPNHIQSRYSTHMYLSSCRQTWKSSINDMLVLVGSSKNAICYSIHLLQSDMTDFSVELGQPTAGGRARATHSSACMGVSWPYASHLIHSSAITFSLLRCWAGFSTPAVCNESARLLTLSRSLFCGMVAMSTSFANSSTLLLSSSFFCKARRKSFVESLVLPPPGDEDNS